MGEMAGSTVVSSPDANDLGARQLVPWAPLRNEAARIAALPGEY